MEPLILVADERQNFLSEISYLLGQARVVIEELNSAVVNGKIVVTMLVRKTDEARKILEQNGYRTLSSQLFVLKTDTNGERASIDAILKKNHVKINEVTLLAEGTGTRIYSYAVDKQKTARRVLKPFMLQGETLVG